MGKNKSTKLTVAQLRELHFELNGVGDFKGLLKEKLPLVTKYHLTDVAKAATEVFNNSEPLRVDLINQYGVEDQQGGKTVPQFKVEKGKKGQPDTVVLNPDWEKFQKEWEAVITVEKDIQHHTFAIEEFAGLETDANYPVLFSLLSEE